VKRAAIVCVLALAFAPGASGMESTIYPGVGIGKVKLGMTFAQVKKQLGTPQTVEERSAGYVDYGWDFSTFSVGFIQRGRTLQTVSVATTLASQKTPDRVGPGTKWLALVKAYPHGLCTFSFEPPYGLEYLVPHKGGTQTIFRLKEATQPASQPGGYRPNAPTYKVVEAAVRTPYRSLPEFAPSYPHRCMDGWRTTPRPRPNP